MRKLMIVATVLVFVASALRRFGPALGRRVAAMCQGMFDRMPEEFPPKRMMRNLEEIGGQNDRILALLEDERTTRAAALEGR